MVCQLALVTTSIFAMGVACRLAALQLDKPLARLTLCMGFGEEPFRLWFHHCIVLQSVQTASEEGRKGGGVEGMDQLNLLPHPASRYSTQLAASSLSNNPFSSCETGNGNCRADCGGSWRICIIIYICLSVSLVSGKHQVWSLHTYNKSDTYQLHLSATCRHLLPQSGLISSAYDRGGVWPV